MDVMTSLLALDLSHHPELRDLSYIAVAHFDRCVSMLKDDILLPEPHNCHVTTIPNILPSVITTLFSRFFDIFCDTVDVLWDVVKHIAWTLPADSEEHKIIETMFQHHGQDLGICE